MVKKNSFFESLNLNLFSNKSGKKSYNGILIIAGILGVMFLAGLVVGDRAAIIGAGTPGVGSNLSVINEDVTTFFNVTINYTSSTVNATNVTQVNITIPSSFTFTAGSNRTGTDARNGTFNLNSSTVLTWTNFTNGFIGNLTNATLGFNITAANPGNYTIIINISTFTAGVNQSIINVNVNDTTAPHVVFFNTGTPVNRANLSVREIIVNVSANDTFSDISSINITLQFPNSTIANFSQNYGNYNGSGAYNGSVWVNFTGTHLTDGMYMLNISNIRDLPERRGFGANNTNATGIQRNITIDLTAPTITLTKSASSTAHQVVIDVALSDATSGIVGKVCSATSTGSGTVAISGTGGSQTATQTGLGCSTDYTYTVTCTDYSGNSGSKQATVSTDGCSSGGSSGTGGGAGAGGEGGVGSADSTFWILTYNEATTDLSENSDGVSSLLDERYRVKVMIDTKLYYVGVVETTDTTARINVTTTAEDKEVTFNIGDVSKFDVNADNKYDISVTLNGIDSATGKADLSLVYIQEEVPAEEQVPVEEGVGEAVPTTAKSKAWIWILVVVLAVLIIWAILAKKKSRFKNYGF